MRVSVVTPTYGRPWSLEGLYRCFRAQTHPDKELIVADDSPAPCEFLRRLDDPAVRYLHRPGKQTLGTKRDRLVREASGDCIVQFDDDDYYAPGYLGHVVDALRDHDAVKLTAWFGYFVPGGTFFYWATAEPSRFHWRLHGTEGTHVLDTARVPDLKGWTDAHAWGYGFSYAFRAEVAARVRFDPARHAGEDADFLRRVREAGFRVAARPDRAGLVLHVVHAASTSCVFPNYVLPDFLLERHFGEAGRAHVRRVAAAPP